MGRVAQTPLAAVGLLTLAPRSAATTAHRHVRTGQNRSGACGTIPPQTHNVPSGATPTATPIGTMRHISSHTGACVPGTAMTESELAGTAARGNLRRRRMKPHQFIIASLMLPASLPRRRGWPYGYRKRGAPGVTYRNHGRVSEFGSEMGATGLRQAPSGAVCVTDRRWLTWENVPE